MAAQSDIPEEVSESLSNFEETLRNLEQRLSIFSSRSIESLTSELPPLEKAKLNLVLSYATNALFFVFLRTQGVAANEHPVMQELDRVKQSMKRLSDSQELQQAEKKRMRLNKKAAERFIQHGLAGEHNDKDEEHNDKDEEHTETHEKRKSKDQHKADKQKKHKHKKQHK